MMNTTIEDLTLPSGNKRIFLTTLEEIYEDENIVFLPTKTFYGDWFVNNGERTGHILEEYLNTKAEIQTSDTPDRDVVGVLIQKEKGGGDGDDATIAGWSFVINQNI